MCDNLGSCGETDWRNVVGNGIGRGASNCWLHAGPFMCMCPHTISCGSIAVGLPVASLLASTKSVSPPPPPPPPRRARSFLLLALTGLSKDHERIKSISVFNMDDVPAWKVSSHVVLENK